VRAIEGVPRDALNLAAMMAKISFGRPISVDDVRRAAREWYQQDKMSITKSNPALAGVLSCRVAGDRLRTVMSSIMRRRSGLISAIGKLLSEGLGFENPQSSQTGARFCDLSSIAAPAASFNLKSIQPNSIPL
jgi:hypothetical protein